MNAHGLAQDLSVAKQLGTEDLEEVAQAGFRAVICNRPDGEGGDQPSFSEIDAAARKAGLEARYLPVASGNVTGADAVAFNDLGLPTLGLRIFEVHLEKIACKECRFVATFACLDFQDHIASVIGVTRNEYLAQFCASRFCKFFQLRNLRRELWIKFSHLTSCIKIVRGVLVRTIGSNHTS